MECFSLCAYHLAWCFLSMADDSLFSEVFQGFFTQAEWDLWVQGKFNLFENYTERIGMTKDQANALRRKFEATEHPEVAQSSYDEYMKNPLTSDQINAIINADERDNS